MTSPVTKEEAVVALIERYAKNSEDRLYIESMLAVICEHTFKDGLAFTQKHLFSEKEE